MSKYEMLDEGGTWPIKGADTMEEALDGARDMLADGEYGDVTETIYVTGRVGKVGGKDWDYQTVTVQIDPSEPDCRASEHDWQSPESLGGCRENPGVFGHGGGVIIHEVCAHCGMMRKTDTWAQNRATGEQGLTSVAYREADAND